MNIFTLLENEFVLAKKEDICKITSISIGCFDALHLGHFKLINELDDNGALLIVVKENNKQIVPNYLKNRYVNKAIFFIKLEEIVNYTAKDFISKITNTFTSLKFFVAGYDFKFGKNRSSSAYDISTLSGLECKIINEECINGISVHTSTIKDFLTNGKIKEANLLLGRAFAISGKQIKGQGLGSKFFVPTININYNDYFLPKEGVYYANALLNDEVFKAAVFIGKRSTDGKIACEIHLLNVFKYDKKFNEILIEFIDFYRENKSFTDLEELKKQIDDDILILSTRAKNEQR